MRENQRDNPTLVPAGAAPSGPKVREWGKPQGTAPSVSPVSARGAPGAPQGFGKGAQGYSKPVGFVKAEDAGGATGALGNERQLAGKTGKTDEELEVDRKDARKREEENSFRDVSDHTTIWESGFSNFIIIL